MLLALVTSGAFLFNGCKSTKKAVTEKAVGTEFKELPCQGPKFRSDKNYFRGSNMATSSDLALSKEKAMLAAKQNLSGLINSKIKSVTDRYVNEREFGEDSEFEQKFENLTREVVNQRLVDIAVICEKTGALDNGKYRTFIALEVEKDAIMNGIDNHLSKNKKLQIDYDKMKYEQIFNEEMQKLEEE